MTGDKHAPTCILEMVDDLRPARYRRRWSGFARSRLPPTDKAEELVRLPMQTLLKRPDAKAVSKTWTWNASRRTFCTYHVAKYKSADHTAIILRQIGGTATLHNSHRGLEVTRKMGVEYISRLPRKISQPILLDRAKTRTTVALPHPHIFGVAPSA